MKSAKYHRTMVRHNRSTCPVCGRVNNHLENLYNCGHIAKVTVNKEGSTAWYFWGFRPDSFKAQET